MVQSWLASPSTNDGFVVRAVTESAADVGEPV
jgi:hypothetical protein